MLKHFLLCFLFLSGVLLRADERPLVVTLHPILAELTGDLVGESAAVKNILPANADVHRFEPTPRQMVDMQDAVLIVAMGKHLEPYLERLEENLSSKTPIYEAGRLVPSVTSDPKTAAFACCPVHGLSGIDPHWWQSPRAMRRATRHLGRRLEKLFPEQKKEIRERTKAKMKSLEELDEWTEKTLDKVPGSKRKLVTTHAAFGYFCARYHFQAVPLRSLTNEKDLSPEKLAETMTYLRKEHITALFPESEASSDFLRAVHEATGIPVGKPLNADFILQEDESYEEVFRQNVKNIVSILGEK